MIDVAHSELSHHARHEFAQVLFDHSEVVRYVDPLARPQRVVKLIIIIDRCEVPAVAEDGRLNELASLVAGTGAMDKPAEEGEHAPVECLQKSNVSRAAHEL